MEITLKELAELRRKARELEAALEAEDLSPEEELANVRKAAAAFVYTFSGLDEEKATAQEVAEVGSQ